MDAIEDLKKLFQSHFGESVSQTLILKSHASKRKIYRLISENHKAVGVENADQAENRTFVYFSRHFRSFSLPVPQVYAVSENELLYLQEDLGDTTLFDLLFAKRSDSDPFPLKIEHIYNQVVSVLPRFQVQAGKSVDYNKCHKFQAFSREHMLSDMNDFRMHYLDRTGFSYDPALLQKDFEAFAAYLSAVDAEYFLYRDFQSRNIMVRGEELYFIDFQGGCKGALQYDIASLLFQAQARIPPEARERILGVYLNALAALVEIDKHQFLKYFYAFVILRTMQVLGTYGLRGLHEGKQYFIDSIEFALINLRYIYRTQGLPVKMPEIERFINGLTHVKEEKLTLTIYSFSYKLATETPFNPHGGGFVFDSRCLPNPGREEQYKTKCGLDKEVSDYLEAKPEVGEFFNKISAVVDQAITGYIKRKFLSLSVAFGCTGGQHRSVFLAEKLAAHMRKKFDINVLVHHLARDLWVKEKCDKQ